MADVRGAAERYLPSTSEVVIARFCSMPTSPMPIFEPSCCAKVRRPGQRPLQPAPARSGPARSRAAGEDQRDDLRLRRRRRRRRRSCAARLQQKPDAGRRPSRPGIPGWRGCRCRVGEQAAAEDQPAALDVEPAAERHVLALGDAELAGSRGLEAAGRGAGGDAPAMRPVRPKVSISTLSPSSRRMLLVTRTCPPGSPPARRRRALVDEDTTAPVRSAGATCIRHDHGAVRLELRPSMREPQVRRGGDARLRHVHHQQVLF